VTGTHSGSRVKYNLYQPRASSNKLADVNETKVTSVTSHRPTSYWLVTDNANWVDFAYMHASTARQ